MGIPFRIALIFALLFVILKLTLFNMGKHEDLYVVVVFGNIFFILMTMIFGLRTWKKANPGKRSYTDDVKITMQGAVLYVVLVSAFAYLYYTGIDKQFIATRIQERVEIAEKADFDELQKKHPEKLSGKTREDFIDEEREQAILWYSPFFMSTLMLMAGLIISLFYSFLIAWFWRKFMEAPLGN